MRYLIFGYGYLGSTIYFDLKKKNKKVLILTTNNETSKKLKKHSILIDLKDKNFFFNNIKENDIIIFSSFPDQSSLNNLKLNNINKFKNLFNSLINASIINNAKEFIFFSSIKVYDKKILSIYEHSQLKPQNNYAKLKIIFENKILNLKSSQQTKFKILRLSNIFGLGKNYQKNFDKLLIPSIIIQAIYSKSIDIKMPDTYKDFLPINIFINKFNKILSKKIKSSHEIYNVGYYKSFSIKEISIKIKNYLTKDFNLKINFFYKKNKKNKINFHSNHSFLKKNTNNISFEKEIKKLIKFYYRKINE